MVPPMTPAEGLTPVCSYGISGPTVLHAARHVPYNPAQVFSPIVWYNVA